LKRFSARKQKTHLIAAQRKINNINLTEGFATMNKQVH